MEEQLLEWARKAIEYGVQNVPVVVEQYLSWWKTMHIMGLVLGSVFLLAALVALCTEWFRKAEDRWDECEGHSWGAGLTAIIAGIVAAITIPLNIYYLVKISVAPAVYIIDNLTH